MRRLSFLLASLLLAIQYPLWFGKGGWFSVDLIQSQLTEQRALNERLVRRNAQLAADVWDLKTGTDAIEERARYEFGMIGADELFFYFVRSDSLSN